MNEDKDDDEDVQNGTEVPRPADNPWLFRFAALTAVATFALIGIGGLVTSKGAGMAVPDWPTSYGYNMFLLPISMWQGGIFYEHTHRLAASVVGMLTAILAGWIWARGTTGGVRRAGLCAIVLTLGLLGVRRQEVFFTAAALAFVLIVFSAVRLVRMTQPLRWSAAIAFGAVVVQGVLGGLRVTAMKDEIGIVHGMLAQLFLTLLALIAMLTTRWWENMFGIREPIEPSPKARRMFLWVTVLIFLQLGLGATMRHQHAGLAVPDFPLAHGRAYPRTDAASVAAYNSRRLDVRDPKPVTAAHIHVHMAHRAMAVTVLAGVFGCVWTLRKQLGRAHLFTHLAWVWFGLVCVQALLGAVTVWSNKAADVATAHVLTGAAGLVLGALLTVCLHRLTVARINAHALVQLGQDEAAVRKDE